MKRKYTFIVGAGASCEFGFPVGAGLTKDISDLLSFRVDDFGRATGGDLVLKRAFELFEPPDSGRWSDEYIISSANDISANMGLAPSIDNYLEAKKDKELYPNIGKLAIARAILKCERNSKLWVEPRKSSFEAPNFSEFPENWLTKLFQVLSAQRGLEGFLDALGAIRFVTFNYDRLIEKFFWDACKSYFDLDAESAQGALSERLNIVHVYGSLGELRERGAIEFGADGSHYEVHRASLNIKTFTEGVSEHGDIEKAKIWISESEVICFLGFAFLPLNLRLIRPHVRLEYHNVIGTKLGMSQDNVEIAKGAIKNTWFDREMSEVDLRDVTCSQLISDISGRLSEADLMD